MRTIELSGIIKIKFDDWAMIKLVQEDGYRIDLISRFRELVDSFGSEMQVSYYISEERVSKREMIEGHLKKLYGDCEASYESTAYAYSSWTT